MQPEPPHQIVLKDLLEIPRHPERLSWEPFRPGIRIYRLYGSQSEGPSAALLWYEPGASVPLHEHLGYEHLLILSNMQTDNGAERTYGTFIVNPPGSKHSVSVPAGGIVLAIWEKPVRLAASDH